MKTVLDQLDARAREAVAHYWQVRTSQSRKQKQRGTSDQGLRGAVTGGAQMDGFIQLFADLIVSAGVPSTCVFMKKSVELPGFFRATKE